MNESIFEHGSDIQTYVASLRNYRSLVRQLCDRAEPRSDHVAALRYAVSGHSQPVRATVMTEDWCGDSAANLPIIARLCELAGIELRILRGSEQPDLKDHYRDAGVDHIPVLSLWDGTWTEVARWVEAPAVVQRKKEGWKQETPDFLRLYEERKHNKSAAKQFNLLYRQYLDEMTRWYEAGDWNETTREIVEALQ